MPAKPALLLSVQELADLFEKITAAWGLSPSERDALRGTSIPRNHSRVRSYSTFVIERMGLTVEIDQLLGKRMEDHEIRSWLRRPIAGVVSTSPLDEMVGSTDHLRRVRAMLAPAVPQ